ncbi:MAG TPA: hypothetical protein H9731_06915 [Candidatus Borkfalkia excrementipullorum]|nr:hypothetical protein [Candidatus Borkfalkia excrementipullorum]
MKVNYGNYASEQLQSERRKLHRKLILPNIFILLISLAAAVSLLFGQLLSVSVHIDAQFGEAVAQMMSEQAGEESGAGDAAKQYAFLFKDADADVTVSVRPLDLLAAGFDGGREGVRQLITNALGGLSDTVNELSEQILPAMISVSVAGAAGADLENADLENIDTGIFADTVAKLNDQDFEGAEAEFSSQLDGFLAQFGVTLTEDERAQVMSTYDELVSQATVDGEFNAANIFAAMGGSGEGSEGEGGATDILAILSDPGAFADQLDEETLRTVNLACTGLSAFLLVQAGLWAILALFAFLHIFLPNKKVGMWYVKLLCWLPCFIFFIAPPLALAVAPNFVELPAVVSSLAFGGMTFISGICLLALWLISIFWCHPIKKRIKQCTRVLKERRA